VVLGLLALAGAARTAPVPPDQLPEPVAKTFKTMFPNGTIQKLDAEEENGVVVYDFEFKAGDREKETDIAADGTMLESTLVIVAKDIPAAPMKRIQAAAKGAKIGRLEWIETRYELKEGKVIKLAGPVIKYAAEMTRSGKRAEIIVGANGTVLEEPEWLPITDAKAPAPAGSAAGSGTKS
jgi:hypothetical protein